GNSVISAAEFFIDATGGNGTGTAMTASDTVFDTKNENVTGTLSTSQFNGLGEGSHTIFVHGKDAANNWSSFASATLTKDTVVPTIPASPGVSSTTANGIYAGGTVIPISV